MWKDGWGRTRIIELVLSNLTLLIRLSLLNLADEIMLGIVLEDEFRWIETALIWVNPISIIQTIFTIFNIYNKVTKEVFVSFHYFCGRNLGIVSRLLEVLMVFFKDISKLGSKRSIIAFLLNSSSSCVWLCPTIILMMKVMVERTRIPLLIIRVDMLTILIIKTEDIYLILSLGTYFQL